MLTTLANIVSTLFAFIASIFPLLFILIVAAGSVAMSYAFYDEQQKAWTAFAKSKKLKFLPGGIFQGNTCVFGSYRGYHLDLNTHGNGKYLYTKMRVYRTLSTRNQNRRQEMPTSKSAENVIDLLAPNGLNNFYKQPEASSGGDIFYTENGVIKNVKELQRLSDQLCDIAGGYAIVAAMGGEAAPELQKIARKSNHPLQKIAVQLLQDIAANTTANLKNRASHLLCPHCLTHFGPHKIKLSWLQSLTYYGCRSCGQSRAFFYGNVAATLDNQMPAEQSRQKRNLRINWLAHRAPFDFDAVEIIHASDEDVERFAVQVGNDTDPLRKARYPQMRCLVAPKSGLSENTIRILKKTFGSVETA